jgi:uncharacterized protein (DUF1501 family)
MLSLTLPSWGSRSAVSRRELLRAGAVGLGGVALPWLLRAGAAQAGVSAPGSRAKSVILLYLSGGPSQLDMWDPKPGAPEEIRGTFRPIATRMPGVAFSEHLPRMAALADKFTVVRSMSHDEAEHLRAGYWVMTGARMTRPAIQATGMLRSDRPHFGSLVAKYLGGTGTMPANVAIPEFISPVGVPRPGQHAGFLGPEYDPYLINSDPNLPEFSPGALRPAPGLTSVRIGSRRTLLAKLDGGVRYLDASPVSRALEPYYAQAFDLISSPAAHRAFDISAESEATRNRYGRHIFGQSALVARRLVEAGVRLVQVNFIRHDRGKGGQGYDSHSSPPSPPHLEWARTKLLPPTDAAFASLIEDLSDRGLLDETLVIMTGEFGRTPRFNKNGGRDHWPKCYSAVLAGGGVRSGSVFGVSDRIASTVISDPVSPEDLIATVYHQLGIDPRTEMHDQLDRPFPLVNGKPVWGLLA